MESLLDILRNFSLEILAVIGSGLILWAVSSFLVLSAKSPKLPSQVKV